MSWDIFVQDIPPLARSVKEIPPDFDPTAFGKRSDLVARIREVAPNADFTSPAWGSIEGLGYSIEVNMGEDEHVKSFAFHVRGGDQAPFVVSDILERLGLRAFDPTSESGIFGVDADVTSGLRAWRTYRDQVLGKPSA
jgi:hypothetical protein